MFNSKSCRCEYCASISPKSPTLDCSQNWKNRFSKLRKQWSEHSRCGNTKKQSEDCTNRRSSCNETVGKFGVAWVADIPNCVTQEPKGWQAEIIDTPDGILRKCKQLIQWLSKPPAHLYDNIEGNNMHCNQCFQRGVLSTCKELCEDHCWNDEDLNNCDDVNRRFHKSRNNNYSNNFHDNSPHKKKSRTCLKNCNFNKCDKVGNSTYICNSLECNCERKPCIICHRTTDESSSEECSSRPHSRQEGKNLLGCLGEGEIFRKQNCCCHCQDKYYKSIGTTYQIDMVPQKDFNTKTNTPELSEIDSKIVCAGIRSSKICRKLKEEKRNQLIEKHERELHNTVIASIPTGTGLEEDTTKDLYVNTYTAHRSATSNLVNNVTVPQRRSSQLRRKETL